MASQQVGPQVKNNPRKQVRWMENMDQVLINGLFEIVLVGPKRTEKRFKSEEFRKVIQKVREVCHISVSVDNVRGRLRTLKKESDDFTELFRTSGFGLDSSGRVSVDPITWETYIKEKSDGAKMKGKLCPRYYDLLTVFGNDAATRDRAVSGNDFPPISEPVDDLEGKNDVEETQPSHSINSHRSVQGGPPQTTEAYKTDGRCCIGPCEDSEVLRDDCPCFRQTSITKLREWTSTLGKAKKRWTSTKEM